MNVIMCKTNEPLNHINKTFYDLTTMELRLKKDFDIAQPTIIITGVVSDLAEFNYFQFTDLSRYYYVKETEMINNKLIKFYLVCDVLETYKTNILNSTAILKRKLKPDDVQAIDILSSNGFNIEKIESNVTLNEDKMNIMSVLGGVNND